MAICMIGKCPACGANMYNSSPNKCCACGFVLNEKNVPLKYETYEKREAAEKALEEQEE